MTRSIKQKLTMRVLPASELRALAVAQDHREIAALVSLPLLREFPAESEEPTLEALAWVLKAALVNCDGAQLEQAIRTRIENPQLPAAQRIYCVAAGFMVAPRRYDRELRELANEAPPGPRELKSKLTELLSVQERSKISVCVVEVCKPGSRTLVPHPR